MKHIIEILKFTVAAWYVYNLDIKIDGVDIPITVVYAFAPNHSKKTGANQVYTLVRLNFHKHLITKHKDFKHIKARIRAAIYPICREADSEMVKTKPFTITLNT